MSDLAELAASACPHPREQSKRQQRTRSTGQALVASRDVLGIIMDDAEGGRAKRQGHELL